MYVNKFTNKLTCRAALVQPFQKFLLNSRILRLCLKVAERAASPQQSLKEVWTQKNTKALWNLN